MSDLIDRQALRKAMYHEAMEKDSDEQKWDSGCWIRYKMFERVLDSMPPVEPKRKEGKWVEFDSDEDKYDVIKCPCCKHIFTVDSYHWTDIGFIKDDFKFCPNCGADMRGEENG